VNKKGNNNRKKPEADDTLNIMLSVLESLNKLYERLSRLNYLIEKRRIEIKFSKKKENLNEN